MATNNPYRAFVDGFVRLLTEDGAFGTTGLARPDRPLVAADAPKALIFAPHPDDEVIIGGLPLRLLRELKIGHIGFNAPLSALMSRTRDKALMPLTRQQNAEMFGGDPDKVPKRAVTMGVGTILDARELLLLATGRAKASILAKAVEGPITAMISASAIQLHPNCKVIVDEDAARELKEREYYDWIFQNEPEWQEFRT
jgi:glucosamine-6-phosphate deaminase